MIVYSLLVYSREIKSFKNKCSFRKGGKESHSLWHQHRQLHCDFKNVLLMAILINPHCFPKIHLVIRFASIVIASESKRLSSIWNLKVLFHVQSVRKALQLPLSMTAESRFYSSQRFLQLLLKIYRSGSQVLIAWLSWKATTQAPWSNGVDIKTMTLFKGSGGGISMRLEVCEVLLVCPV